MQEVLPQQTQASQALLDCYVPKAAQEGKSINQSSLPSLIVVDLSFMNCGFVSFIWFLFPCIHRILLQKLWRRGAVQPRSLTRDQLLEPPLKSSRRKEPRSQKSEMLQERLLFGRSLVPERLLFRLWLFFLSIWLILFFCSEIKERNKKTKDEKRAKKAEASAKSKVQAKGAPKGAAGGKGPKLGGGGGKRWLHRSSFSYADGARQVPLVLKILSCFPPHLAVSRFECLLWKFSYGCKLL